MKSKSFTSFDSHHNLHLLMERSLEWNCLPVIVAPLNEATRILNCKTSLMKPLMSCVWCTEGIIITISQQIHFKCCLMVCQHHQFALDYLLTWCLFSIVYPLSSKLKVLPRIFVSDVSQKDPSSLSLLLHAAQILFKKTKHQTSGLVWEEMNL